jgi:hypothetical protein
MYSTSAMATCNGHRQGDIGRHDDIHIVKRARQTSSMIIERISTHMLASFVSPLIASARPIRLV